MADTKPRESLLPAILAKQGLTLAESEQLSEMMAARLAAETDVEKLLDETGSLATQEIIGIPFQLRNVVLNRSTIADSIGVYMLLDAVMLDTGEEVVITTSAAKVMVKAGRLAELGALPRDVKIIEARAGEPGRSAPLTLVAAKWQRHGSETAS